MVLLVLSGCSRHGSAPTQSVSVDIDPATGSVEVSAARQFTATVRNTSNTAVTWQVNGVEGGSALTGTISATGLYTAPGCFAPSGVTITAVSQSDTSKSASASVALTATGNAKLNGRYASLAYGFSPVGATDARLMRLAADGSGGLTATGVNHHVGGNSPLTLASSAYTVVPGDRGCVNLGSFSAGDPLQIGGRFAVGVSSDGLATKVAFIDGDTVGTSSAGVWHSPPTRSAATSRSDGAEERVRHATRSWERFPRMARAPSPRERPTSMREAPCPRPSASAASTAWAATGTAP
jgi:hypothetical protein